MAKSYSVSELEALFNDKDVKKSQETVIKTGDPYLICAFAENVKGADVNELQKAIIATGNSKYIKEFAQYVKGADVELLEKHIKEKTL